MKKVVVAIIGLLVISQSCKNDSRFYVDTAQVNLPMSFIEFYRILGNGDSASMDTRMELLADAYPDFLKLYTSAVIQIGSNESPEFKARLTHFITDSIYRQVYDTVANHFTDLSTMENTIHDGFKRYKFFFPEITPPDLYFQISGFNESVIAAPGMLAISLENYLGSKNMFYTWLSLYTYLRNNMYPEKIPSDALWSWFITEFDMDNNDDNLLNRMVYEGKILFLLQQVLPDEPLNRILSYTPEQLAWCNKNEASMWSYIIEYKHLFSKDQTVIKKYTDIGPFTHFFGNDSSPRTGAYIGWSIVTAFMKNNPDVGMKELMSLTDGQYVLANSRYKP